MCTTSKIAVVVFAVLGVNHCEHVQHCVFYINNSTIEQALKIYYCIKPQ